VQGIHSRHCGSRLFWNLTSANNAKIRKKWNTFWKGINKMVSSHISQKSTEEFRN
jgi:hypothetical protein